MPLPVGKYGQKFNTQGGASLSETILFRKQVEHAMARQRAPLEKTFFSPERMRNDPMHETKVPEPGILECYEAGEKDPAAKGPRGLACSRFRTNRSRLPHLDYGDVISFPCSGAPQASIVSFGKSETRRST
jgi:hypothetical protein